MIWNGLEKAFMANILLITNELSTKNGWATVGCKLYEYIKYCTNDKIIVISRKNNNIEYNKEDSWNLNLISSSNYTNVLNIFDDYTAIYKKLENQNIDIIICNIEPYLPLASILKRKLNAKKLILIGHGTYIYYPFIRIPDKYYHKIFVRNIDLIIVPSNFTYNKVKEWYDGKTHIIKWGVDTEKYYPLMNIKKDRCLIFVGQQKERKGVIYLFEAFKRLTEDKPDIKLYMVGKKADKFVQLADKLGINQNVVFTGEISHNELLEYFSKSMCHILPSINTKNSFEGFGLVHLEANACGIPSIGSLGTANEDVIIPETNGYLCPQKNSECLYHTIKLIFEDNKKYTKLCEKSLNYAQQNSWENAIKDLYQYIKK